MTITIDEAIKILTIWKEEGEGDSLLLDEAEKLAIEALKWVRTSRKGIYPIWCKPLPGETEVEK